MSTTEREVTVRVKVCDGCGSDIQDNAIEGLHYATIIVKVRVPRDKEDWIHRSNPILMHQKQVQAGTTKILHVHLNDEDGHCKIKGSVFRTVVDAFADTA